MNILATILISIFSLLGGYMAGNSVFTEKSDSLIVGATPIILTTSGGTGTSSPSGLLYGDETIRLKTVTIGSNLTFSGGTLSATGGSGGSGNVSTSTGETSGQLAYWTSTNATPALLGKVATTSLTATLPLSLSQPIYVIGGTASALSLDTSGTWSGNAGTASALAANGANCSAGSYPLGVNASGAVEDCTDATTEISSAVTSAYPFTPTLLSGITHSATSSSLMFPNSLLASTTIGRATIGTLVATSSVSFPAGSVTNTMLQNSTISGIALGSNLNALTAGDGLTSAGTYTGNTARTFAIDFTRANTWSGLQTFGNSTTSRASFTYASSTQYFGAGLQTCDATTGKLHWANGRFTCETDREGLGGSGDPFAWTPAITYGESTNSTTTPIWFKDTIYASSTSFFSDAVKVISTTTTNALQVGSTAIGNNVLKVSPLTGMTCSTSESVGGCLGVDVGSTDSIAGVFHSNNTGANRTLSVVGNNTSYTGHTLYVRDDGTTTAFNLISAPLGQGAMKWSPQGAGDVDASGISLDASLNSFLGQALFIKCGSASNCFTVVDSSANTIMRFGGSGNMGLGTSTPGTILSIANTANFSSATSTFYSGIKLNTIGSGLVLSSSGNLGQYQGTSCTNQFARSINASGVATCESVANTDLANSTISGISLGSNLANLTATDTTLTFSGTYNGGTARTIGLNLGNANTWTGIQTFGQTYQASSTVGNLTTGTITATTSLTVQGPINLVNPAGDGDSTVYLGEGGVTTMQLYYNGTSNQFIIRDVVGASDVAIFNRSTGNYDVQIPSGKLVATGGVQLPTLLSCTEALETDASGNIICGTDATGGGGGVPDSKWATSTVATAIHTASATEVGISTTSPQSTLSIREETANADILTISAPASDVTNFIQLHSTGAFAASSPAITWRNTAGGVNTARISSSNGASYANSNLIFSVADSAKNLIERARFNVSGNFGIGTTSPYARLSVAGDIVAGNIHATTSIRTSEKVLATSTSMTVSFLESEQQIIKVGTSAVTVTFSDVNGGDEIKVLVCNPAGGTPGAVTFSGVVWNGGVNPGSNANVNQCDAFRFMATLGTTTSPYVVGSLIGTF